MLFNSYQFTFGFLPAVCVAYFVVVRFWGARAGAAAQVSAMYRVGGQSVIDPAVTYWWAQWQFLGEFRWSESSALWLLLVGSIACPAQYVSSFSGLPAGAGRARLRGRRVQATAISP
jgi:hypothetical protein